MFKLLTRPLNAQRPMRRNCICVCGTQVRAPIGLFQRGLDCPNCGRLIVFEAQVEHTTTPTQDSIADSVDRAALDFNTKEIPLSERIAKLPKWMLLTAIFGPLLVALVLLLPSAAERFGGRIRWSIAAKKAPTPIPKAVEPIEWSKLQDWNTNIDPRDGKFDGYRVAKEFSKLASASDYQQIERLFEYEKILIELRARSQDVDRLSKASDESLERQLSELVRSFLEDSQFITDGCHDWRVIGVRTIRDNTVLLLRYHRELMTPLDLLDDEELLLPMVKLVSFDQFNLYCDNLFKTKMPERRPDPKLMGYLHPNFFADKSFGYVVLLVSGTGRDAQIQDMFDYQVKKPLSQLCLVWTGAANVDIGQIPAISATIPGPSDADLRLVQNWIRTRRDKFRQFDRQAIRTVLQGLWEQTKDPLMQDLLGRLESDDENQDLSMDYFRKAKAAGCQTVDAHRIFIQEIIQAKDRELLTERLHDLNKYWDVKITGLDAQEDRKKFHKFQGYWRRGEGL